MTQVFIALGTNLGNRRRNLTDAREQLAAYIRIQAASSIHETPPWGFTDQPDFLNQVLSGDTDLPPYTLLQRLKTIEAAIGRKPSFRYGPRLIDLDLLAYGLMILESPHLKIPHPRMHERRFVLAPLVEIAPHWMHPLLQKSAENLLNALP